MKLHISDDNGVFITLNIVSLLSNILALQPYFTLFSTIAALFYTLLLIYKNIKIEIKKDAPENEKSKE